MGWSFATIVFLPHQFGIITPLLVSLYAVYSWVRPPPCVHVLYNVVARVANLPMNCLPFWYWPIIHHDEYPGPLIISQLCKDYKVMYVRYVRWDDHHRSSQSHIMKLLIKNSDIFRLFQDSTK